MFGLLEDCLSTSLSSPLLLDLIQGRRYANEVVAAEEVDKHVSRTSEEDTNTQVKQRYMHKVDLWVVPSRVGGSLGEDVDVGGKNKMLDELR